MATLSFFEASHPFSNYYPCEFTVEGITYGSVEHYFQAQKFNDAGEDTIAYFRLLCEADTPQKAKDMGNQRPNRWGAKWLIRKEKPELGRMNEVIQQYRARAVLRPDWEVYRMNVMREGLRAKFSDPRLAKQLCDTGDCLLVEASPYDSFWGAGRDGRGQNHLGKLLMELRADLRMK